MKKLIFISVVLALSTLILMGCPAGISRYTYDGWLWTESQLGAEYEGVDVWQLPGGDYILQSKKLFVGIKNAHVMRISQSGGTVWVQDLPELHSVSSTPPQAVLLQEEGVLVAGIDGAGEGSSALRATRLSLSGETIWSNEYQDFAVNDLSGKFFSALGSTDNMIIGALSYGNAFIKITPDGEVAGTSRFDVDYSEDPQGDEVSRLSLRGVGAASGGGVLLTGYLYNPDTHNYPALLKGGIGNSVYWIRSYPGLLPGRGIGVLQTADGGYVVGAEFDVYVEAEERYYHPAGAFKVDADGYLVWKRDHLTPNLEDADQADVHDMGIDHDGNIIIVGEVYGYADPNLIFGTPLVERPFICKLSGDGDLIWFKMMEDPGNINGVGVKNDGGYVTAGMTGDAQLQVIHFDTNGNIVDVPQGKRRAAGRGDFRFPYRPCPGNE